MNPITLAGFAGASLAPDSRLLSASVGAYVVDAEPWAGDLRPLRARTTVATVPAAPQRRTLYRLDGYWLSWPTLVNVIRTFDGSDPTHRIFYTGDGAPKVTSNAYGITGGPPYPQASRPLSVPAPTTMPVASLNTQGTGTDGITFYVYTFVNDMGWESAPSPVSSGLACKTGAIVDLVGLDTPPVGNYGITRIRIYRTQPGTTAAAASFFFLREIAVGLTSSQDDARALGIALATIGWRPFPDNSFGLIALWNGMAAALVGKTVMFTVPYSPYSAPSAYDLDIQRTPIATAKWEQNLLVLTDGAPSVFTGQDPAGMSETPSLLSFACASATSVVGFSHGVVWASNEGLAYTGQPLSVITTGIFTVEQWKALNPASIVAGRWGRFYVASYNDGTGAKGFMFDPLSPSTGVWFLSTGFDACWYDELADELYVLEGANVRKFADTAGAKLTATFRSKKFHQAAPRNFGWGKVVATTYPCTIKVYADGVLKTSRVVNSENPFTLKGGFTARDWQIEVSNDDSIEAVHLAVEISDFKQMA
jgi:hypothetical protein